MGSARYRPDRSGPARRAFDSNRARILATQDICGICGRPVDKSLKYPDPGSATIDHIIPVDRGGHPSDMANLQLAHLRCNRLKSDKLMEGPRPKPADGLPWSRDWLNWRQK